jgi:hypothetical protein
MTLLNFGLAVSTAFNADHKTDLMQRLTRHRIAELFHRYNTSIAQL